MQIVGFDDDVREYVAVLTEEEAHELLGNPQSGSHYKQGHTEKIKEIATDLRNFKQQQQAIRNLIGELRRIANIQP